MAAHSDDELEYDPNFDFSTIDMDAMEEASLTVEPQSDEWAFPSVFRSSIKNVIYEWRIAFVDGYLITRSGTKKAPQFARLKIIPKVKRNLNQQAYLQASRKFKDRFYKGYQMPGASEPPEVTGMKGQVYEKGKIKDKDFPVLLSAKLDGVRVLAQHRGGHEVQLRSYGNKDFSHLKLILEQVEAFVPYLPPYATLDGEAYCHGMHFHEVVSAVKTNVNTHANIKDIKFYIFDIYYEENPPSQVRYQLLQTAFESYKRAGGDCTNLTIVPQWYAHSHEEIVEAKDLAIANGYEGIVIRRCCDPKADKKSIKYRMSQYGFGRSARVFKYKDINDEEGVIVRVEQAKGKEEGLAMLIVKDKYGFEIPFRRYSNEERRLWFKRPNLVIGKKVTFKHMGRHPETNVAQKPTFKCFRDYED